MKPRKKKAPAPVAARQAEAEDGFAPVELCGVSLRVPVGGKVPLAAIDLFRAGDNYGGTKALLGEAQWNRLIEAGGTADDLDELSEKLGAGSGT